jgi:threo-3-hydroxy-D-aspartate ammonia-lyase
MNMLDEIMTPSLLLDEVVMRRNIDAMAARVAKLGGKLRPHLKTHKSIDVAAIIEGVGGTCGFTVSTLEEAEYFFAAGYSDLLYSVGLSDAKVPKVASLVRRGCKLTVITDNQAMADRIDARAAEEGVQLSVMIELDVDGHRSGLEPEGEELLALATAISNSRALVLAGVMTHAGGSYSARTEAELAFHAEREVARTRLAAQRLRAAGFDCPMVSIGSTPTASAYVNLDGITEVRAGVYVFFDLVQAGIGVARHEDIAISVLTTVIGHQPAKGWVIVDAGWMAMSRDRGTSDQDVDYGYGQVCDVDGQAIAGVIMTGANQEHGIIAASGADAKLDLARFPVGSKIRIKPNHACSTAGQFSHYDVLRTDGSLARWDRMHGR